MSEIDFVAMCRRAGLPPPSQQVIPHRPLRPSALPRRTVEAGRRPHVTVEIDGAAHRAVVTYWDDMYRGNELVISGEPVLRHPSVAVRLDEARVIEQLRVLG